MAYNIQKIDEHKLRSGDNVDRSQEAQALGGDPTTLTRAAEAGEEEY